MGEHSAGSCNTRDSSPSIFAIIAITAPDFFGGTGMEPQLPKAESKAS